MKQNNQQGKKETTGPEVELEDKNATNKQSNQEKATEEIPDTDKVSPDLEEAKKKCAELNDSYLRLMAEYDNYRKRTLREKAELIKNGGEKALTGLLPVVDDFERALKNISSTQDVKACAEGVELIYSKFLTYLSQQGVKPIDASAGKDFDTEEFEAIATVPAPSEDMKGKVLDCVQTGYTLNDKVIRHAKVVVGE
ncbi:nucleotide exchange factor GrpE [Parabacteroides pacaensis]|uniref:nucleotide exchange factor GrpE n=1 Tax=Parabacteroides pacaensis TaxID=2086575 RepID=UPI000D100AF7|nr:nucleotide exchange factor GrpE [Parabacteroides pacaensis]